MKSTFVLYSPFDSHIGGVLQALFDVSFQAGDMEGEVLCVLRFLPKQMNEWFESSHLVVIVPHPDVQVCSFCYYRRSISALLTVVLIGEFQRY